MLHFYFVHLLISFIFVARFPLVFDGPSVRTMCRHRWESARAFIYYLLSSKFFETENLFIYFEMVWFHLYFSRIFFLLLLFVLFVVSINSWTSRDSESVMQTNMTSSKHIILVRWSKNKCNVYQHFLNSIVLLYVCFACSVRARERIVHANVSTLTIHPCITSHLFWFLFFSIFFFLIYSFSICFFLRFVSTSCWLWRRQHWTAVCYLFIHSSIGCHLPVNTLSTQIIAKWHTRGCSSIGFGKGHSAGTAYTWWH